MNTPSPFSFLSDMGERIAHRLQPPPWLIHEAQQKVVLLLNHVLMQEPVAMDRLTRQKGRVVLAQWRQFNMALIVTPAGLFNVAPVGVVADLQVHITEPSPLNLAKTTMQGAKPPVRIEGDVQLAAEMNWLVDHVRWDIEEDLARAIGDVPAHNVVQGARRAIQALRQFVQTTTAKPSTAPSAHAPVSPVYGAVTPVDVVNRAPK